ncbi:MAG: hypothetical protein Q4D85_11685 [Corynebacterium sp.]|uniref:hypothetical protein n=1 Tax=Corynebacterium sp. TaxID=1720 RepID=UPI0026DBBEBD|nr:hypothetical protein [Corynebacterium sp.]MDO5099397.1 hypothetical protein [Corynebacterium sp.]
MQQSMSFRKLWDRLIVVGSTMKQFTPHNRLSAIARSLLGAGTLLTFTFTPREVLFFASDSYPSGVICDGLAARYGLYCAWQDNLTISYILTFFILAAVIFGILPGIISWAHFWVVWSFATQSPLIDGGDQIAQALALIFLVFHFGDFRLTHWENRYPSAKSLTYFFPFWWAAVILFIAQGFVVYFHASIGKIFVPEWANGTGIWYWLTDPTFAPPEHISTVLLLVFGTTYLGQLVTYSILIIEFCLAIGFLFKPMVRKILFSMGIMLHVGFALTFGLWSFLFSMSSLLILHLLLFDRVFKVKNYMVSNIKI